MLNNILFGRYFNTKSFIHNLNSSIKIIAILLLILSSVITNNIYTISILFIITCILILLTNMHISSYLKQLYHIKYLILLIIFIDIILNSSIILIIISILKLIIILMLSSILTFTTKTKEIIEGLNYIFIPLSKLGINTGKVSFNIALSLRFIPTVIDQTNNILNAMSSRGLDYKSQSLENKYNIIKKIIFKVISSSLSKADKLADMMEIKNYDINRIKIKHNKKVTNSDIITLIVSSLVLILTIVGEMII